MVSRCLNKKGDQVKHDEYITEFTKAEVTTNLVKNIKSEIKERQLRDYGDDLNIVLFYAIKDFGLRMEKFTLDEKSVCFVLTNNSYKCNIEV